MEALIRHLWFPHRTARYTLTTRCILGNCCDVAIEPFGDFLANPMYFFDC